MFEEDQVILTFKWSGQRVRINGSWKNLKVHRLGDVDLFLSKLMRNDAQDIADAKFVVDQAGWNQNEIRQIGTRARYPRSSRAICYLHGSLFEARATDERTSAAGSIYRYRHVPQFVYRELLKAESAGKFWNAIKDQFEYEKLN